MHRRIATIHAGRDAILELLAAPIEADWVEVRLDAIWPGPPEPEGATDDLVAITDAAAAHGTCLLATLRPTRQGGAFDGPEEVRLGLLVAALRAGFAAVDVEGDNQELWKLQDRMRADADSVVVSDHGLAAAPSIEAGLLRLRVLQDGGGDIDKLAFPTGSFLDNLRSLELAHAHAGRGGHPCIAPIGARAQVRALLPLAGNRATYGSAPGSGPAVTGQPSLQQIQAIWEHWGIDQADLAEPAPAWLAVLGRDVAHSLSPRIHNAALRAAGHRERFGALDLPDSIGAMRLVTTVASRIGIHGASVTHPLKGHALAVSRADGLAAAVGAANCLRFQRDATYATNTDATAFASLFERHRVMTESVLVLGAGGAARAAIAAARSLDIDVRFTSRDPVRAAAVAAASGVPWLPWDDGIALRADTVVQATSARLDPIPACRSAKAVIELVYDGGPTPLEAAARAAGLPVVGGKQFLVAQAIGAFEHWFGDRPDRAAMEAAL